jgi:DNA-binding transcriptional LysR family regulator
MNMNYSISPLRKLDIDDIMVWNLLAEGKKPGQIARELKLSAPAISHRLKKFQNLFGKDIFEYNGREYKEGLSEKGKNISKEFVKALLSLSNLEKC